MGRAGTATFQVGLGAEYQASARGYCDPAGVRPTKAAEPGHHGRRAKSCSSVAQGPEEGEGQARMR
eukprot:3417279-Alexandrium_andersonii.AAC.1